MLNSKKKPPAPRKRAVSAVLAMSQGDRPTLAEFLAAWKDGLVDVTTRGETIIREYLRAGIDEAARAKVAAKKAKAKPQPNQPASVQ